MKLKNTCPLLLLFLIFLTSTVFADYKLTQQISSSSIVMSELTVFIKGSRKRVHDRALPNDAAIADKTVPQLVFITQCDLNREIRINVSTKSYFTDYFDWSELTSEQAEDILGKKITIKGTATINRSITESGKIQTMFGLSARWLKYVETTETSPDACDGKKSFRTEQEGWFVNMPNTETCRQPAYSAITRNGCYGKLTISSAESPGFFLEGTTRYYQKNKLLGKNEIKTFELSETTLDQSLFEIPTGYVQVKSLEDVMKFKSK